ncbi:MAG: SAM-dependent DNA methyltransferase [Bacteroidales bacterium]|nr:SAM-dependent DNA methyltransferase [Bacteroidales bacterium]
MKNDISLIDKIIRLVYQHICCYPPQECQNILDGFYCILNKSADYTFDRIYAIRLNDFQLALSKINEKEARRKNQGVYYTPKDITEYIVANTYLNYTCRDNSQVYSQEECFRRIDETGGNTLFNAKVFDPTCGTAEFLLSAIEIKLRLSKRYIPLSDADLLALTSSIFGNDISYESILLSKIRIYFTIINELKDKANAKQLAKILNKNFTCRDYITVKFARPKYDIIVGNPPYVEYGKLPVKPDSNYGNIYADVLCNAVCELKSTGVIGFVIPLSFVATSRMQSIREDMYKKMNRIFILNYADRPDCLFDGVHQKLSILFGIKGQGKCTSYTSSYYHWYNSERRDLLNNCKIFPSHQRDQYIPKIGNVYEDSIFEKICNIKGESLLSLLNAQNKQSSVYVNMRACFWMKAFSFNPGSKEYKEFGCSSELNPYLLAILNSNLFFLYWTIVSDCWHITNKELSEFFVPTNGVCLDMFRILTSKLERKLERTKKYIGSVQTQYEYKHRECKPEIDAIDDALQEIYGLTDDEVAFLKEYKLKYRMSNGTI